LAADNGRADEAATAAEADAASAASWPPANRRVNAETLLTLSIADLN
jgi:hypothetical protein